MTKNLTELPLLRRIQDSNFSDWNTLRYDELGTCIVIAEYQWGSNGGLTGGGGVVVEHDGHRLLGRLSIRDTGEYVVVLSTDGHASGPDAPVVLYSGPWADYGHDPENIDRMLQSRVGVRLKTGEGRWMERLPHPTTETKVVIRLR